MTDAESFLRKLTGHWVSQSLYVAAKLGVADHLTDGPKTAESVAEEVGCHGQALHRLMRLLASEGVFVETDEGFALTSTGRFLTSDSPNSLRWAAVMYGEEFFRAWNDMLHTVTTGETGFDHHYGQPVFEYYREHPETSETFNRAMTGLGRTMYPNSAVIDAFDFSPYRSIVDIGGGHGDFLCDVLDSTPESSGVLFDVPHVVSGAEAMIRQRKLSDRCTVQSGDFFSDHIPKADAYLLKRIIHDWDDERAAVILQNCASALNEGGRVLVVEAVIPEGNEPFFGKNLDLHMMMVTGGQERTEDEYRLLFQKSGLKLTRVIPSSCPLSVVEGAAL